MQRLNIDGQTSSECLLPRGRDLSQLGDHGFYKSRHQLDLVRGKVPYSVAIAVSKFGRALLWLPGRNPSGLARCPVQIRTFGPQSRPSNGSIGYPLRLHVLHARCLSARLTWKRVFEFPILLLRARYLLVAQGHSTWCHPWHRRKRRSHHHHRNPHSRDPTPGSLIMSSNITSRECAT